MIMDEYQVKLGNISKKIGVLIGRYNDLKENYRVLEEQNKHLKQQVKEEVQKSQTLTNQLNVLKLSKTIPEDEIEKTELKKKINEFIKEIDKCVALLND